MRSDPDMRGVIPNSFDHIFTHIARTQNQQYLVRASYLEIYQVHTKYNIAKQSDINTCTCTCNYRLTTCISHDQCISIFRQFVWLIFCVLLPVAWKLDIWQEGSFYITLLSTPLQAFSQTLKTGLPEGMFSHKIKRD